MRRNFEYYSEDPLLAGRLAGAMVQGLQSQGVSACVKHFACNTQETDRLRVSADVDKRALREIYLRVFELTIREGNPWAVMSAYNRINGVFASENPWLLTDVLRGEWGYEGVVISAGAPCTILWRQSPPDLTCACPGGPATRGCETPSATERSTRPTAWPSGCASWPAHR